MGKSNLFIPSRERQADKSAGLLRDVQHKLTKNGIRTLLIRKVRLKLRTPRPALPGRPVPGAPEYHPPELAVFGPAGTQVASVVVGPRSGCYVISGDEKIGLQTADSPDQVAELLAACGLPTAGQEAPLRTGAAKGTRVGGPPNLSPRHAAHPAPHSAPSPGRAVRDLP